MIKKTFKDFILLLESDFSEESENDDFFNAFDRASYELRGTSWSRIAKKIRPYDSAEIWEEINDALNSNGLSWTDVKQHKDEILKRILDYSSKNAFVDVMLYNLDNNYKVGGWDESITKDVAETYIRYRYGYHETTYGRIFIKSYWGDIEYFIECVAKNILEGFIQDSGYVEKSNQTGKIESDMEEEGDLVQYEYGKATVYLENFYYIAKPFLIGFKTHNLNYDKFKSFFLNWLDPMVGYHNVEDMDEYIIIDFSEQL